MGPTGVEVNNFVPLVVNVTSVFPLQVLQLSNIHRRACSYQYRAKVEFHASLKVNFVVISVGP